MILAIHHVQITIPKGKEDQAREFYCGLLGLREISKPENRKGRGGFWLQLSASQLHVGTEDGVERAKTKAHVAYEVSDLLLIKQLLQEKGFEICESLPVPGYESIEIRDPFGNRIELTQKSEI